MEKFRFVLSTKDNPLEGIKDSSTETTSVTSQDSTNSFSYTDPFIKTSFIIRQESTREIGFKLYPGALELCAYFQKFHHPNTNTIVPSSSSSTNTAIINPSTDTTSSSSSSATGSSAGVTNPSSSSSSSSTLNVGLKRAVVLELGSGVCAIPSLALTRMYPCLAVATDMPALLPLLQENLEKNNIPTDFRSPTYHETLSRTRALSLTWGEKDNVVKIREKLGYLHAEVVYYPCSITAVTAPISPDIIIAADVIYHDPLIEPLLQTLIELTDYSACSRYPPPSYTAKMQGRRRSGASPYSSWGIYSDSSSEHMYPPPYRRHSVDASENNKPRERKRHAKKIKSETASAPPKFSLTGNKVPLIIVSYVQRFKRAKQFFKLAKKYFDIDILDHQEVVDYDVLTWLLPIAAKYLPSSFFSSSSSSSSAKSSSSSPDIVVTPESARYDNYLQLLIDAGARAKEENEKTNTLDSETTTGNETVEDNPATKKVTHHIDTDSDDEWDNNEGYTQRMMQSLTVSAISMGTDPTTTTTGMNNENDDDDADAEKNQGEKNCRSKKNLQTKLSLTPEEETRILERQKRIEAAKQGAAILGVPFVSPSQSYIYLLRRKMEEKPLPPHLNNRPHYRSSEVDYEKTGDEETENN